MTDRQAEWRLAFFREQLYSLTYRQYLKAKDEIKLISAEMYAEMGIESEEEDMMTEWPDFFEVDNVANVRKTDLKPKPKLNNYKSTESLL